MIALILLALLRCFPPVPIPEACPDDYTDDDAAECLDACEADDDGNPDDCPALCAGLED